MYRHIYIYTYMYIHMQIYIYIYIYITVQPGWGSQWSTPDLHGGSDASWTVYIGWDIKCYPARNLFDPSGMHGTGLGSQQFHPRSIYVVSIIFCSGCVFLL